MFTMMSALTRLIIHLLGDPLLEYQHDDNQKIDPVKEWKHKVSQEEDEEAGEPEEEGSDEKDTESGKSAAKEQVDPEKVFQCTVDTDGQAQERAAEAKSWKCRGPTIWMRCGS
uniref:DNA topoisomerase 2 n=1 Tax=Culex pipiens TaxID=7175 RepID=A0A8D8CZH3_CULPI